MPIDTKRQGSPVRAIHVLGSLGRGGAETWVVQLLEHMDNNRVQTDVLVHRDGGTYERRIQATGANIYCCDPSQQPFAYMQDLKRIFMERGPYDVVHCHLQLYNGMVVRSAKGANIPGRIAHARNSRDGKSVTPGRLVYRSIMRYWIKEYATHLFAVSTEAGKGAFGEKLTRNGRCRIMTGIDFSLFHTPLDRRNIRKELSIPEGALVVGHVGSFRRQKNHQFLLDISRHIIALQPNALVLLIGDGPLRQNFEEEVSSGDLQKHIVFLGERKDVVNLLYSMDVFVFPSLYEGLPRALLEAQAAGLPCVASRNISPEVAAWPGNIQFLLLEDGAENWTKVVLEAVRAPASKTRGIDAVKMFESRGLSITSNANELMKLYERIASTDS